MSVNIGSTIKEWLDEINSKAASSHGHSINDLTQGYLNIHPENGGSIIPFIHNDLAFLNKKGGSYSVYSTTDTDFTVALLLQTSLGLSGMDNMFDGSPSYAMITTTGAITVVIDMTLHKMFSYSNQFYIDFGNAGWRTKGIAVYAMNSNTETKYTLKGSTTTNAKGNWYCGVAHSSKNSEGTTVQGFNKLRVVLTNFNNTSSTSGKRIAQVGLLNYGSAGVTETFVSRGGSTMYGDLNTKNLYPTATNASNLGSSSKQYNTIYGKTIYENGTALSSKYATLDSGGKVPASQLPSYVDDVLEYSAKSSFPATGEAGKIYVDTSTNITYRWSGSAYVAIGSDLALGETSATAYRGDRGKTAYDHSQKTSGNPHGVTKTDVGLGNVENKSSATIRGEITKANVTSALGYTPTSDAVVPNNSGEIKTKFRVSLKADAGRTAGTYRYYKLCDLPTNDSGNYASAIISGRIGGWTSGDMSYINALVWNRGTPGMALIDIAGTATAMSSIWNTCELVLYVNGTSTGAANTATLYAKCYSWFTFDLDIETFQSTASITYDGTYITTTPTGTLAAQSSTSTKRLELINGELQVNGKKVLTEVPAASATTRGGVKIAFDSATGKLSIST